MHLDVQEDTIIIVFLIKLQTKLLTCREIESSLFPGSNPIAQTEYKAFWDKKITCQRKQKDVLCFAKERICYQEWKKGLAKTVEINTASTI